ncbi:MAG: hypothetical protein ACOC35_16065 [Promethearchaeia archaeon]
MSEKEEPKKDIYYQNIVKKTTTGSVTIPKDLRDEIFDEDKDYYFRLFVPNSREKIVLEILSEEEADKLEKKFKKKKKSKNRSIKKKKKSKKSSKGSTGAQPNFNAYFMYEFDAQEKVKPILESAFDKFSQTPVNLEDAMGRVKYALISFLSSTKTENAKLYFSIVKFLVDVIEKFDQPNLIEWIYEKVVPNINSKFLFELSLLELVEVSLKSNRYEKAKIYTQEVLENIDQYPKSELYNIMNSFTQLVKKVKNAEKSKELKELIKEKLLEYEKQLDDVDYKIQIIEMLEDLKFIEIAYKLAKEVQVNLPPESIKVEDVRALVKRLHEKPI